MDETKQITTNADAQQSQFEKTTRQITEELSLKQISQVLLQNWPLYVILFCTFALLSWGYFWYKVPYVSTASVIVNDSQNSSLQSFAQNFSGVSSNKINEAKKSNSPLQKYLEYLKTTEFYEKLISAIETRGQDKSLSLAEKQGYTYFYANIMNSTKVSRLADEDKVTIYRKLEAILEYKISADFELEIKSSTKSKEMSLFLTNAALDVITNELKAKDTAEVEKIKSFLFTQKELVNTELSNLNKKLAEFHNKPENIILLSSKDKVGEYISDLMVRKNELRLKISENTKAMNFLTGGSSARRESQLYGNGGRIQALKIENEMLAAKAAQLQVAIDRVSNQAKALPMAGQVYEELKKKSDIEFAKYKELSESLSKAEAYSLSLSNKFEILEKARFEKVKPLVNLLTLFLISFILAQVVGSLIIYITSIWSSNLVTAQSTRNVVVIDSHSLDPRVIIENSKIKFRLQNSEFSKNAQPNSPGGLQANASFKNAAIGNDFSDDVTAADSSVKFYRKAENDIGEDNP